MERPGAAFSTGKENSFPCCFFPQEGRRRGWKGHPGLLQVADKDGVNW